MKNVKRFSFVILMISVVSLLGFSNFQTVEAASVFESFSVSETEYSILRGQMVSVDITGVISESEYSKGIKIYLTITMPDGSISEQSLIPTSARMFLGPVMITDQSETGKYTAVATYNGTQSSTVYFTVNPYVPKVIQTVFAESSEIPSWIKVTAGFWVNGEISDDEFMAAIQFLINEGILAVPGYDPGKNISPSAGNGYSGSSTSTSQLTNAKYGPIKYLSFKDSPFYDMSKSSKYFYLEDFENSALLTPGVSSTGSPSVPSTGADSVDHDDGLVDGYGYDGHSFWTGDWDKKMIRFTFDEKTLGQLPTFVGLVFTDTNYRGNLSVTFEVYDSEGFPIDKIHISNFGDQSEAGETGEDRFVGISYDAGIKAIKTEGEYWFEIDHLQYGR